MPRIETGVVWLSQTWPIRRRWRLKLAGRVLLSIPLRAVRWSQDPLDGAEEPS